MNELYLVQLLAMERGGFWKYKRFMGRDPGLHQRAKPSYWDAVEVRFFLDFVIIVEISASIETEFAN